MNKKNLTIFFCIILFCAPLMLAAQEKKEPVDLKKVADDTKFDNARQFYNIRDYNKALLELNEYLEIYINGAHRNEANRYIARIYFDRFEYMKSIQAYNAIFEDSSTSEEGIEAYYRTGICFQKMGDESKAVEVFKSIIDQYPYSNFAYLSKIQLDLIKIVGSR